MKKSLLLPLLAIVLAGCTTSPKTEETNALAPVFSENHGYLDQYDETSMMNATNTAEKVAVFVSAKWCGPCVAQIKEMQANQQKIPAGTVILVADFDKDTELNEAHGVTNKHTAIYFSANKTFEKIQSIASYDDILAFLSS